MVSFSIKILYIYNTDPKFYFLNNLITEFTFKKKKLFKQKIQKTKK